VTNTNDSGPGSLRQAILDANATPVTDTIAFSIGSGVQTITPLSALPSISDPVIIDGTTQPGFAGAPIIELNGSGVNGNGLVIFTGNSTVRGMVINRFGDTGIQIKEGENNVVEGNYLGTDASGTAALGGMAGGCKSRTHRTIVLEGPPPPRGT
jgi:hypothetical protein